MLDRRKAMKLAGVAGMGATFALPYQTVFAAETSAEQISAGGDPYAGGLNPEDDLALTALMREDPQVAETFNVWLYDPEKNVGINVHPAVQGGRMGAMASIFLPDGRVLRAQDEAAVFSSPSEFGSKHIQYTCKEPFREWAYRADKLPVFVTSGVDQKRGGVADKAPSAKVSFEIEAVTKAPPYIQGTLLPEAGEAIKGLPGRWIAVHLSSGPSELTRRYDQALAGAGSISFEGQTYEFSGYGLRGHVRGVRDLDGMEGHTWIGAVFPSGICLGVQVYPRSDGGYHLSEAYLYKDGVMYPNRVIYASRLNRNPDVHKFVVELACDELGLTRIVGEDRQAFWWSMSSWTGGTTADAKSKQERRIDYGIDPDAPLLMKQAVSVFELDGEIGSGMCERSGTVETSEV